MTDTTSLPRFKVDLSEAALDGLVSAFYRPSDDALRVGQDVQLVDDEGNVCPGVVTALDKHVAYFYPALDRVTLAPLAPIDALRALLQTPPSTT